MTRAEQIQQAISDRFTVQNIEVIDESESHRGHAGFQEGGESHFRIRLQSPDFKGMNRLKRHRAVHAALGADLIAQIHALALELTD